MKSSLVLLVILSLSARVMRVTSQPAAVDTFYDLLDTNKDGSLDTAEFKAGYMKFDTNGDNVISEEEYVTNYVNLGLGDENMAKERFAFSDVDDDQLIDQKDLDATIAFFDANGDGTVPKGEFISQSRKAFPAQAPA